MDVQQATQAAAKPANSRQILQWIIRLIPAVLLLVFVLINRADVSVNFVLWQVRTSLIWALLFSSGLGFAFGFLLRHFRKDRKTE